MLLRVVVVELCREWYRMILLLGPFELLILLARYAMELRVVLIVRTG